MTTTIVELEPWNYTAGDLITLHGTGQGNKGLVLSEITGLHDAAVRTIQTRTAFQVGSSFGGLRWDHREVTLLVHAGRDLNSAGPATDWETPDATLRKALSYEEDSLLWVQTPNSRRCLRVRLMAAPELVTARDPRRNQSAAIQLKLIALNPFWIEDDITDTWVSQTGPPAAAAWSASTAYAVDAEATLSTGEVLVATAAGTSDDTTEPDAPGVGETVADGTVTWKRWTESGTVTVSNPTDRIMWLKWTVSAPGTWVLPDWSWFGAPFFSASALPGDVADLAATATTRTIPLPTLGSGAAVDIDIDPFEEQAVRAGVPNFWALMNGKQFLYPVPPYTPGTELPVAVDGPAGSTVNVFQPREWTRPWGMQ